MDDRLRFSSKNLSSRAVETVDLDGAYSAPEGLRLTPFTSVKVGCE